MCIVIECHYLQQSYFRLFSWCFSICCDIFWTRTTFDYLSKLSIMSLNYKNRSCHNHFLSSFLSNVLHFLVSLVQGYSMNRVNKFTLKALLLSSLRWLKHTFIENSEIFTNITILSEKVVRVYDYNISIFHR